MFKRRRIVPNTPLPCTASTSIPEGLRKGIFVVIAAYNEGPVIGRAVSELRSEYPHILVVDDGSGDETALIAHAAGAVVLRHVLNRGQGAALQSGITYALRHGADVIVTFDADGQHRPGDVARLVAPILSGEVEATLGSRFIDNGENVPWTRRLLLSAGILFTWITTGARLSDTHNGLRAFSRKAAKSIDIQLDRMAHASELIEQIHRSGLRYKEIPVRVAYTEYSLAKGQRATGAMRIALDYLLERILR